MCEVPGRFPPSPPLLMLLLLSPSCTPCPLSHVESGFLPHPFLPPLAGSRHASGLLPWKALTCCTGGPPGAPAHRLPAGASLARRRHRQHIISHHVNVGVVDPHWVKYVAAVAPQTFLWKWHLVNWGEVGSVSELELIWLDLNLFFFLECFAVYCRHLCTNIYTFYYLHWKITFTFVDKSLKDWNSFKLFTYYCC